MPEYFSKSLLIMAAGAMLAAFPSAAASSPNPSPASLLVSPVPFYHDFNLSSLYPVGARPAANSNSGPVRVLTLQECIQRALSRNQDYNISRENLRAAAGDIAAAWGQFTPNMFATYGISQNTQTSSFLDMEGNLQRFTRLSDASSATLGMSFNVFDRARMYFGLRNAYYLRGARRSELRGMELDVANRVRAAYFDVLRQQRLLEASEEQAAQLSVQLRQAEARLRVGEVTKLDVLQARIDLQNEELRTLEYQNLLAAAREELNLALGGGMEQEYSLADEFRVRDPDLNTEELIREAQEANPVLRSLALQLKQEEGNLWMGRLAYLPSVKATVGYSRSASGFHINPDDTRGAQVGVSAYWSILDGFLRFQENRYTQAAANSLRLALEKTRLEVARDVRLNCLEILRLYGRHLTLDESRDLAAQSLELERRRYILGSSSMVEVRKAQADYIQAEVDYINSIYDYHISLSELSRSLGREVMP